MIRMGGMNRRSIGWRASRLKPGFQVRFPGHAYSVPAPDCPRRDTRTQSADCSVRHR